MWELNGKQNRGGGCDLMEVVALCYQLDVPAFPLTTARSAGLPAADPVKHTLSLWCLVPGHGS